MTDVLRQVHPWVGYVVVVLLLAVSAIAFERARSAREFVATPFSLALVLLDVQVLLGLILYGTGEYWEAGAMVAYVHPALGLAALVAGHIGLGRARRQQMAVDAHRTVGRAIVFAIVLVIAAIGVATAA